MLLFWFWLILLAASIVIEVLTATSLASIWFAFGAIAGLIANQFDLPFIYQGLSFFIVSIISLIVIRPAAKKYLRGNIVPTNADRLIGVQTKLLKSSTFDQHGEVTINGITWNTANVDDNDIEQGSIVTIVALSGCKLIIKKL